MVTGQNDLFILTVIYRKSEHSINFRQKSINSPMLIPMKNNFTITITTKLYIEIFDQPRA